MTTSHAFLRLLLLWLANNGLRITILAARPVIRLIRNDLGISGFPSLPPAALRAARAALVRSEISRRSFSAKAA